LLIHQEVPVLGTRTAPSRRTALAVLCAGQLMIILDGTIVGVALPAIRPTWASPPKRWPGP
jgi:hypothetical protein